MPERGRRMFPALKIWRSRIRMLKPFLGSAAKGAYRKRYSHPPVEKVRDCVVKCKRPAGHTTLPRLCNTPFYLWYFPPEMICIAR